MNTDPANPFRQIIDLRTKVALLEADIRAERGHANRWQRLAERYGEVREWLRLCPDTPEGHTEFYNECARIIFPDSQETP